METYVIARRASRLFLVVAAVERLALPWYWARRKE